LEQDVHHRLTIARHGAAPRKEICTSLDELSNVIDYAIKWRTYSWEDYTDSMLHRIEFSGEALKAVMQAGLESLARKRVRRHPEVKEIKL
jgi:hypothetical protein